jgi:ketosteroid isomerase-like protein
MSQENDELVRRVYDLLSRSDIDQALAYAHPNLVLDWSNGVGPTKGVYRGHAEVRAFWTTFVDAWGEVEWVAEETVAIDPERVIAVVTMRGRGRGSGASVAATGASIWTIADGKLKSAKLYQSKAEALEAAELSEQPP